MNRLEKLENKISRNALIADSLKKEHKKEEAEKSILIKNTKRDRVPSTFYMYSYLNTKLQELADAQTKLAREADGKDIREIKKSHVLEYILQEYFKNES